MPRLDQERQNRLEPLRHAKATKWLRSNDFEIIDFNEKAIFIQHPTMDSIITFYPYSGWITGKGIADGRGFNYLKQQLIDLRDESKQAH